MRCTKDHHHFLSKWTLSTDLSAFKEGKLCSMSTIMILFHKLSNKRHQQQRKAKRLREVMEQNHHKVINYSQSILENKCCFQRRRSLNIQRIIQNATEDLLILSQGLQLSTIIKTTRKGFIKVILAGSLAWMFIHQR